MVKIISVLGFLGIYFSAFPQKASLSQDPNTNLNQFLWFAMPYSSIDEHALTNPFVDKNGLKLKSYGNFVIYNELSLKNLTLVDNIIADKTIIVDIYEGSAFASRKTWIGYKSRRLKSNGLYLFIDLLTPANEILIWRGCVELKKIKASNEKQKYQKAIYAILTNLKIEPVITE